MPLLSRASHQPSSLSFFNIFFPSKSSATNSANAIASRTHYNEPKPQTLHKNESTAIILPRSDLFGRNGIKSNFNHLARMKFGDSVRVNNIGDRSNDDFCNTSNSTTGDAKAYKILNSLS